MKDLERRLIRLEDVRGQGEHRVHVLRPLPGETREATLLRTFGEAGPPPAAVLVTVVRHFDDESSAA